MKKLIKGEKLLKLSTIFKITKFDFLFGALNKVINQTILNAKYNERNQQRKKGRN
jgi:hypothetical protein